MMMIPRKNYVDLFDDVFDNNFFNRIESKMMKTDIKEKDGEYIFAIDIPGVEKENINIEFENGYMTVKATMNDQKDESKDDYVYKERYSGEASRSFYLGENIDEKQIHASFKNGVLNIIVPKEEENKVETKKQITIE